LRSQGLEPLPELRFFDQLAGLLRYICDLITKEPDALRACKTTWPIPPQDRLAPPAPVLGSLLAPRAGAGSGGAGLGASGRVTPAVVIEPALAPDKVNRTERSLQLAEIEAYQRFVCVDADGSLGAKGSLTRTRLREYLIKINEKPEAEDDAVTFRDKRILDREIRQGRRGC